MSNDIYKMSRSEAGKLGYLAAQKTQQKQKQERIQKYFENPKRCPTCNNPIPYKKKRTNKFCSRKCSRDAQQRQLKTKRICKNPNCDKTIKGYQGKYCSRLCFNENQRINADQKVESNKGTALNVKSYLIRKFGDKCMSLQCVWDFEKLPIKCELEHIDGNSENNTLENCILLCPNCHSLTPTYKAKNKGKGRASRRQRYRDGKSY